MSHQDRREPLPKGYQFGDAAWRPAHENAAAQLARLSVTEDEQRKDLDIANGITREGESL